jgi:hypothetical protein
MPDWYLTKDGDKSCLELYERHYSAHKYKDGRKRYQFVGPGFNIVLRTARADAFFVWRKFIDDSGQVGINCAAFRNESPIQSSELVRQADAIADCAWPGERHYTYVDPKKIRRTNPRWRRGNTAKPGHCQTHTRPAPANFALPPASSRTAVSARARAARVVHVPGRGAAGARRGRTGISGCGDGGKHHRAAGAGYQNSPLKVFGDHDENTLAQMRNCMSIGNAVAGVICADGHLGYAQPVGGVIAYEKQISISGVGFDIGCGNMAVRLDTPFADIQPRWARSSRTCTRSFRSASAAPMTSAWNMNCSTTRTLGARPTGRTTARRPSPSSARSDQATITLT